MIKAKYTVVLKSLMDEPTSKARLDEAMSTYPLYKSPNANASYIPSRDELNSKILNRYKYREIGFETPGRFIDELEIALNEIMPYYNQLFKSHDIMEQLDDPFGNVDIVETFEEETTGSATGNSKGTSTAKDETNTTANVENYNKHVKSDTPQGLLDITNKGIDSVSYASEVDFNHDSNTDTGKTTGESETSSNNESTSSSTGKTTHTMTKKGNQGVNTYAHDMKELRETFLNIVKDIIEDTRISELFMNIY